MKPRIVTTAVVVAALSSLVTEKRVVHVEGALDTLVIVTTVSEMVAAVAAGATVAAPTFDGARSAEKTVHASR